MHALMLQQVIKACRERIAQGDCPTTPALPVEQLEEAVDQLASHPESAALAANLTDADRAEVVELNPEKETAMTQQIVKMPWNMPGKKQGDNSILHTAGFGSGDEIAVEFTTPANAQTNSHSSARISALQYQDQPLTCRVAKLSTTPFDFAGAWGDSDSVGQVFSIGVAVKRGSETLPELTPNTTYYFNIRNTDVKGNSTCSPGQSANMIVSLTKAAGT